MKRRKSNNKYKAIPAKGKQFPLRTTDELMEAMQRVAIKNERSINSEINVALNRHIALELAN